MANIPLKSLKIPGLEDTFVIANPDTMTGATTSTAGTEGLVPAPAAGSQDKFLRADGTWSDLPPSGSVCTIYRYTTASVEPE